MLWLTAAVVVMLSLCYAVLSMFIKTLNIKWNHNLKRLIFSIEPNSIERKRWAENELR